MAKICCGLAILPCHDAPTLPVVQKKTQETFLQTNGLVVVFMTMSFPKYAHMALAKRLEYTCKMMYYPCAERRRTCAVMRCLTV